MRGSRAKQLRRFAKIDSHYEDVWAEYHTVKARGLNPNKTMVVLDPSCVKSYYKLLKKIWKVT